MNGKHSCSYCGALTPPGLDFEYDLDRAIKTIIANVDSKFPMSALGKTKLSGFKTERVWASNPYNSGKMALMEKNTFTFKRDSQYIESHLWDKSQTAVPGPICRDCKNAFIRDFQAIVSEFKPKTRTTGDVEKSQKKFLAQYETLAETWLNRRLKL
nr:hypothetical protein [Candidatus Sigynarchaeota archaeon]